MKLVSVSVLPSSKDGWSSRKLTFGNQITELFGPNGSGKTPIIQAIVYALGVPISFRNDIAEHCGTVALEVAVNGYRITLSRKVRGPFEVEVTGGGIDEKFHNEADYSRLLVGLWGIGDPVITTVSGQSSRLYLAHIMPVFYLRQDRGYSDYYYSASKFIKDQYTEVMRSLFGFAPKNAFEKRRLVAEKEEEIKRFDREIVRSEELFKELAGNLQGARRSLDDIDEDILAARTSLESLRRGANAIDESTGVLDTEIRRLQSDAIALRSEIGDLQIRIASFNRIKSEIGVEINTLSLNEEARRLFVVFGTVCANEGCGLFLNSSNSYGKSLLYLRDQIKDLERSNIAYEVRLQRARSLLFEIEEKIHQKFEDRHTVVASSADVALVDAASRITENVINLQKARQIENALALQESLYVEQLNARERAQNDLASMKGTASSTDLRMLEVRALMAKRIGFWLDTLKTVNVHGPITVDADFNVILGDEKLDQFSGSTRTRIILAVRTAAFEILTSDELFSPRFLILDTPKQQDLAGVDLGAYILQLKQLARRQSIQVVFSTTEYHYQPDSEDNEWTPSFPGAEKSMFLGHIEAADRPVD